MVTINFWLYGSVYILHKISFCVAQKKKKIIQVFKKKWGWVNNDRFFIFLFLYLQFHSIPFVALEFKVDMGFAFVYIIPKVCVRVLWLWLHSCSRCLASPLAQLVCPCKTTLGLRMKYETLAPYFTLAVAGLKDGSLDVCLPFPSTLSFSLTSACSHLHLLFFSPYFICSLPSPSSLVLAAKYTYVLSALRERER